MLYRDLHWDLIDLYFLYLVFFGGGFVLMIVGLVGGKIAKRNAELQERAVEAQRGVSHREARHQHEPVARV